MPLYSFSCATPSCGAQEVIKCSFKEYETLSPPACTHGVMRRDYKADRIQVAILDLKKSNEHGHDPSLFLPTAKDYEGPNDPDGSKGLTKWLEEHKPAPGNKHPKEPKLPAGTKKTFALGNTKKDAA